MLSSADTGRDAVTGAFRKISRPMLPATTDTTKMHILEECEPEPETQPEVDRRRRDTRAVHGGQNDQDGSYDAESKP